jgi:hypothetical protein
MSLFDSIENSRYLSLAILIALHKVDVKNNVQPPVFPSRSNKPLNMQLAGLSNKTVQEKKSR